MTVLRDRIAALIAATGPMSVADYMALCLYDPEHGYYTTRDPFGTAGDFTTAPEVSQMFGELVAVWLYAAWQASGSPLPVTLAEIGPGRGTLMKDMLRTLSRLDPAFTAKAAFAMVETSPRLAVRQKEMLAGAPATPQWYEKVANLPQQPLLIAGNELFDAIPIRQYVKTADGWRERVVGLDDAGKLAFRAGPGMPDPALLPFDANAASEGAIAETAPARTALVEEIAGRIAGSGGAGLFIDYGYDKRAVGDTLQAVRGHRYDDVLAQPGEADLTAHVDFASLAEAAEAAGLDTRLTTQRDFLLAMGLLERAGALGASLDEAGRDRITGEVERLAGPQEMGKLFKVLAVMPSGLAVPGF